MYKANRNKSFLGFTLIEVVLAMMIMASGLFILVNSWAGTYNRLHKTQIKVQMAALLERKVVELQREYDGKSLDSIPEEKTDDFGSDAADYSWKMESKKLEVPDLTSSLISREGGADQTMLMIMKTFTDHLSNSIKEIKVTVYHKDGKKKQDDSVTFYMVDYDKPLPIPGAGGATSSGG